jgi:tyrosine-protein phosphatase non-receptor type 23
MIVICCREDVFLGREVTIPDVKFEQACILYNIGALHSILGSIETRQSADVSMCV